MHSTALLDHPDSRATVGQVVSWDVVKMHADSFTAAPPVDISLGASLTIAQGLDDSPHELILRYSGTNVPCIRAIRAYSPAQRTALAAPGPRLGIVANISSPGGVKVTRDWIPGWITEWRSSMLPGSVWQPVNVSWKVEGTGQMLNLTTSGQVGSIRLRYPSSHPPY